MLTEDNLKVIEGLTEDQTAKIIEAAKNATVIEVKAAQKAVYDSVDNVLKEATGLSKEQNELTSAYAKRVAESLLGKITDTDKKVADYKAKIEELETTLKGGKLDEAAKVKIKELEDKIAEKEGIAEKLRGDLLKVNEEKENAIKEERNKNTTYRLDSAFATVESSLMFRDDIDNAVKAAMIKTQKDAVLSKGTPQFNEDGTITFVDSENKVITDPNNLHRPVTLTDLYKSGLSPILKEERKAAGGGGNGNGGGSGASGYSVDVSSARTKEQARLAIKEQLIKQGLSPRGEDFEKAMREAWEKLPQDMPV